MSLLLIVAAVALIVYGLLSASTAPAQSDPNDMSARSEFWITEQVARGGLERTESGQIRKTYEGEQPPDDCPT